tara:strand:+ start:45 stop:191 length:147 start_codon:yes stop_codon:yes gene_type:complete
LLAVAVVQGMVAVAVLEAIEHLLTLLLQPQGLQLLLALVAQEVVIVGL